ncbi:MAG: tRNA lysidine(34) synthetase TilS [Syntrophaceae bacterium]|nr:tRNA lysidine(34) synthetase TilS [Syntrophaceae bacterium]
MDPFLRRISRTIDRHAMIGDGERVLVAVSGGADSVALLEALCRLAGRRKWTLSAAHLNHGLRGMEADRDESFVRTLAHRTGVPLACRRLEPGSLRERQGRSLEEAARDARYGFLRDAAESSGAGRIALGHHRGDQAETVLMNLIGGAGIDGLKGMLPVRDGLYVRPLLFTPRREIDEFLEREGLPFREDATNRDQRFLRNRIRRDLLPHLAARYNRRTEEGLARLADIARRENDFLERAVREALERLGLERTGSPVEMVLDDLAGLHPALRYRIVKTLLDGLAAGRRVGHGHAEAVLALAEGLRPQGVLHLPGGVTAVREYGRLLLWTRVPENAGYEYPVAVPGRIAIPEAGCRLHVSLADPPWETGTGRVALFDAEKVALPLAVRAARPGDRIRPLGLGGTKKLQDVFTDRKVPRSRRSVAPVLEDRGGILWVAGICRDDRARVTEETQHALRVEIEETPPDAPPSQSV